ncbi:MAG TPA: pilin [Candidatus Saccharimonadales bacterium]|nr:pilin [Candidatus Saccharimonadales bacterium]
MWTTLLLHFAETCSVKTFFGIPPWYKYLVSSGLMAPTKGTKACELVGSLKPADWVQVVSLIGLAILDMAFRIAGLVAAVFIIWGGIQYVISQGDPSKTKDAQQTIINALVGLAIALTATAIVSFIGKRLG